MDGAAGWSDQGADYYQERDRLGSGIGHRRRVWVRWTVLGAAEMCFILLEEKLSHVYSWVAQWQVRVFWEYWSLSCLERLGDNAEQISVDAALFTTLSCVRDCAKSNKADSYYFASCPTCSKKKIVGYMCCHIINVRCSTVKRRRKLALHSQHIQSVHILYTPYEACVIWSMLNNFDLSTWYAAHFICQRISAGTYG